jgi:hypothetical protein
VKNIDEQPPFELSNLELTAACLHTSSKLIDDRA